jgi:formamidase
VSDDLPGVRIPGGAFMGIFGVAPSMELLRRCDARERAIDPAAGPVVLPSRESAVPAGDPIASEGLSTIPPRENGGNVDIKQLRVGCRVLLPVFVPGALLSVGDGHFAQGDGEVCGQAVEAAGTVHLQLSLQKGAAAERGVTRMQFERRGEGAWRDASTGPYFATTGLCVDEDGSNHMENLTLAARNALRAMIAHVVAEYGYSREQAYVICSVAVDLKASQLVDVPNISISAFLPLDIFE